MTLEDRLREALRAPADQELPPDFVARVVAQLPHRRGARWRTALRPLPAIAAAVLVAALLGIVGLGVVQRHAEAPIIGGNPAVSASPSPSIGSPPPPSPFLVTDDPRFKSCGGESQPVLMAFPLDHARDYLKAFPNMGYSPELQVDQPAFVVVFDGPWHGARLGGRFAPSSGTPAPTPTRPPGTNDMCIWLEGYPIYYAEIDTSRGRSIDDEGFPRSIDGEQVFRSDALRAWASDAPDDSSFLAAGWLGMFLPACPARLPREAETPLLPPCASGFQLMDYARVVFGSNRTVNVIADGALAKELLTRLGEHLIPIRAVLRVHVHDERAAECPADIREVCERALVVEELVWSDVEATSSVEGFADS
jgi:hypothetical protein